MFTPITLLTLLTRQRAGRAALRAAVPLVAAATLAAGCGTATTPRSGGGSATTSRSAVSGTAVPTSAPTAAPSPVPTTTGGPVTPGQPACTGWPSNVAYSPLPASFVPVAAIRCVTGYQTIPGKGQWLTATLERADKNLAPLAAALRRPPGRNVPDAICPDIAMVPPQFVLISGDGKMIMPRLPLTGCGLVAQQVLAALSALPWQKVSVRLVSQTQTQQEVATGCAPQYRDPFAMYGSLRASPGGSVFGTTPASLQVCVYNSGGAASTPQFIRAATVTGATETALLAGLSGAGRATVCTLPRPMFAVVGAQGSPTIYVELGGCYRVLRYESEGGGLMGLSIGQATPGAVETIESLTHSKP
jgi:hypothetical protein